jgi:hypothetical protein
MQAGVTGRDVVVWRDDADVVRDAAHVEVLGGLLLIEEAVVAAAHGLERDVLDFEVDPSVFRVETEKSCRDFT